MAPLDERVLPHSIEAERSVLGAILLHDDALRQAADVVVPEDFFRAAHRCIYTRILELDEASEAVDLVTLRAMLARHGELDEVGGPAYIAALVDGVPRSMNVRHYASIVREHSRRRIVIEIANRAVRDAYAAERRPADVAAAATEALLGASDREGSVGPVALGEVLRHGYEQVERAHANHGALAGLSTGFAQLDQLTLGLQPEDLVLVAARTAQGKTSFALSVALAAAADTTVAFFSLEMSRLSLALRLIASEAHVSSHRLRGGYLGAQDWQSIGETLTALDGRRLFIDDSSALSTAALRARAHRIRAEHGLGLVVIDYLQLVTASGRHENRTQEVGAVARAVKAVARELRVPVLALAQLSRAPEEERDKRPQLHHLRESGELEQTADMVWLLWRPARKADPENIAEVIVAKSRNGPTGIVRLAWIEDQVRFESLALGESVQ